MKILIAGRSGTGKDHLGRLLKEQGLSGVKSYTTRPRRSEDEDTHIFITPEEAAACRDKAAVTSINGYEYFATEQQVEKADYYIIDPKGIRDVTKAMPDTCFMVIYLEADPEERMQRAVARAENPEEEKGIYLERAKAEDEQFSQFEFMLKCMHSEDYENWLGMIPNICTVAVCQNRYDEDEMLEVAGRMKNMVVQFGKMLELMPALVVTRDVYSPEPGRIRSFYKDGSWHDDSYAVFAGNALCSDEGRLGVFDALLLGPNSYPLEAAGEVPSGSKDYL